MAEDGPRDELPEALVAPERRLSAIWLVPLVAALIAGMLLWRSFQDRGPLITVTFESAAGVEAGRTTLRYRDVAVGVVESLYVSSDLSHVVVSARLHRDAGAFQVKGTRFWVERPRLGPQGVSGLGTLVSGAFIGVDPGPLGAQKVETFQGLEQAPVNLRGEKGLRVSIHTRDYGAGLSSGAPVLYEGIQVGRVTGLELDASEGDVIAQIFIQERYSHFVRENSRFWNASGLHFDASLQGVRASMDSLETVLVGGVGFSTPGESGPAARAGAQFQLYRDIRDARRDYSESLGLHVMLEAPRLGFLRPGDAVLYRGEQVGRVLEHALEDDARTVGLRLQIDPRFAPLVRTDSVFWNASGVQADLTLRGFHIHVASVESLLEGSVSFATPDPPGPLAPPDSVFRLHRQVKERWLSWAPRIPLGEGAVAGELKSPQPGQGSSASGITRGAAAAGNAAAEQAKEPSETGSPRPAAVERSLEGDQRPRHLFDGAHHGIPRGR